MSKRIKTQDNVTVVLKSIALPLFFLGFSFGRFEPSFEAARPYLQWLTASLTIAWYAVLAVNLMGRKMERATNERQRQMIDSLVDGVTI